MDRYATLRHGLVGAWCPSLGDSGYVIRSATQRQPLTHNGAITAAPGGVGLDLTTSQYAELSSAGLVFPDSTTTSATVSMWVRMRSFPNAYNQLWETQGFSYQLSALIKSNGKLAFYIRDSGGSQYFYDGTGTFTLATNTWYHLAYILNGGVSQSAYVNGALDGSAGTPAPSIGFSDQAVRIGFSSFGTRNLNGHVDDVRVYKRAILPSEVRLLATQRGIGLTAIRHRRANVLGSQFWLRDAGTWKKGTAWIKVNGVWTKATPKLNVGGTWK